MLNYAIKEQLKKSSESDKKQYVFFRIDNFNFGLAVGLVRDVLVKQEVSPIPLARSEIIGAHNLRGRIVTCFDIKKVLNIGEIDLSSHFMMLVLEVGEYYYSFPINGVFSVVNLSKEEMKAVPGNISDVWAKLAIGISYYNDDMVIILNEENFAEIFNEQNKA